MDDELLLETNKQKLLTQLAPSEVERRFGNQNSPEFQVGYFISLFIFHTNNCVNYMHLFLVCDFQFAATQLDVDGT